MCKDMQQCTGGATLLVTDLNLYCGFHISLSILRYEQHLFIATRTHTVLLFFACTLTFMFSPLSSNSSGFYVFYKKRSALITFVNPQGCTQCKHFFFYKNFYRVPSFLKTASFVSYRLCL